MRCVAVGPANRGVAVGGSNRTTLIGVVVGAFSGGGTSDNSEVGILAILWGVPVRLNAAAVAVMRSAAMARGTSWGTPAILSNTFQGE
jgi:hypothetical protein